MNKQLMLERLVKNGLDFLQKAVDDLEEHPKFSIIHFHAAVELFLKARLLDEHWSLVVSDRQKLNLDKFISGDFQSVSLAHAATRLEKVVKSGLKKVELQSFRDVTKHRNKAVHFFHEAHSAEENNEQLRAIVKQQLTAWYFLHQLLTKRWSHVFENWENEVNDINTKLKKLHAFLEVTYEQLKPEIELRVAKGERFEACPSCGFNSQHHQKEKKLVYDAECMVCQLSERALRIDCPSCSEEILFVNDGFGECDGCGKCMEPEDLASELIDDGEAHIAIKEGDSSWDLGNCSDCDEYHTVVRVDEDMYICASCLLTLDFLYWCDWCHEPNTGNMEHSSWEGCSHCDGKVGWESDR